MYCVGTDGDLRLAGGQAGPGYEYGRLEIFLRGLWRTTCRFDGFTPDSANVACTALGFQGGAVLEFGSFNQVLLTNGCTQGNHCVVA